MDERELNPADFSVAPPARPDPAAEKAAEALAQEPRVKVTVADWTQIGHEGTVHRGGETFSAPASLASQWIAYGWAVKAGR